MRIILFVLSWMAVLMCYGQNKQLSYNFTSQPQSLMSNPGAAITFEKHIGIPLLSGVSVNAGSSGLSVFDIFETDNDINSAINRAVNTLTDKDFFTAHIELEILSFGWKSMSSEIYFSGGIYNEIDALVYYPRDIALLAYRGNADFIGTPFNFSDISVAAEALNVFHFGVNKKMNDKWQLGARVKLYSSIANANSTSNTGDFITEATPNGPNIFGHRIRNVILQGNTSGINRGTNDITQSIILSGNLGVGFDIGATYTINDRWMATGSIIDLGGIRHAQDVQSYRASGSFVVDGLELDFPALLEGQTTTPYWEEFENQIEEEVLLEDELTDPYTTWRPTRFNASLEYGFGSVLGDDCDCRNTGGEQWTSRAGFQLYGIKRPKGLQGAVTAYYDKRWASFLHTKFTYTYDAFSARNLGALISTKIYNFNLYLAVDNLLELPNLAKARSASFQLGMQLIFDPKN